MIILEHLFPVPKKSIIRKYDLKGSTIAREALFGKKTYRRNQIIDKYFLDKKIDSMTIIHETLKDIDFKILEGHAIDLVCDSKMLSNEKVLRKINERNWIVKLLRSDTDF